VAAIDESLLSDLLAEFLDAPNGFVYATPQADIQLSLHNRVLVLESTDKNAAVRLRLQARVLPLHAKFLTQEADPNDKEAEQTGGVVPMVEFGVAAHVDSLVLKLTGWATGALELQDLELTVTVRLRLGHTWVFPDPVPASLAQDWEAVPASDDDTTLWGLQPHATDAVKAVRAASNRRFVFGIRPGATFEEWKVPENIDQMEDRGLLDLLLPAEVAWDVSPPTAEGLPGMLMFRLWSGQTVVRNHWDVQDSPGALPPVGTALAESGTVTSADFQKGASGGVACGLNQASLLSFLEMLLAHSLGIEEMAAYEPTSPELEIAKPMKDPLNQYVGLYLDWLKHKMYKCDVGSASGDPTLCCPNLDLVEYYGCMENFEDQYIICWYIEYPTSGECDSIVMTKKLDPNTYLTFQKYTGTCCTSKLSAIALERLPEYLHAPGSNPSPASWANFNAISKVNEVAVCNPVKVRILHQYPDSSAVNEVKVWLKDTFLTVQTGGGEADNSEFVLTTQGAGLEVRGGTSLDTWVDYAGWVDALATVLPWALLPLVPLVPGFGHMVSVVFPFFSKAHNIKVGTLIALGFDPHEIEGKPLAARVFLDSLGGDPHVRVQFDWPQNVRKRLFEIRSGLDEWISLLLTPGTQSYGQQDVVESIMPGDSWEELDNEQVVRDAFFPNDYVEASGLVEWRKNVDLLLNGDWRPLEALADAGDVANPVTISKVSPEKVLKGEKDKSIEDGKSVKTGENEMFDLATGEIVFKVLGSGFSAPLAVVLTPSSTWQASKGASCWIRAASGTELTVSVPWGLQYGRYDVHVVRLSDGVLKTKPEDLSQNTWLDVTVKVKEDKYPGVAVLPKALYIADKAVFNATPSPVCPTGIRSLRISGCGFFKYKDDSSETEKKEIPTVRIGGKVLEDPDGKYIKLVPKNGRTIELDLPWCFLPPGEYPIEVEVKKRCQGWTAPSLEMIRFTDLQVVGAHFGGAPFHVLSWDPPVEPLEEPEPQQGEMPSFSPGFQYKLVLLGPVGAPKVKGRIFCRVTSEWGDFDMTSNAVEVEFVSELSTDLSKKKVVPEKQFPTPGEFGLGGGAGPGGLPPGWQEVPKEATLWMGPGEDPVPTDMQKNMQENLDPVLGKGKMGL